MLKFPLWPLLLLPLANPANAACNLILPDVRALTECVQAHESTIALQAREIIQLRKELDYLAKVQETDRMAIDQLRERWRELQLQVFLQAEKVKPGKK